MNLRKFVVIAWLEWFVRYFPYLLNEKSLEAFQQVYHKRDRTGRV